MPIDLASVSSCIPYNMPKNYLIQKHKNVCLYVCPFSKHWELPTVKYSGINIAFLQRRNGRRCQSLFATPKSITTTTLFLARKRIDFIQSCWLRHTTLPFHPSTHTMWGRKSEYRQSIKDDIGQIYRHDANAIPYILGRIYHLFSNLMIGEEAGE